MANIITFYDIPANSDQVPARAWSPNTWKTRFSLNYKGLAYKTEWVEYPDIVAKSKELGLGPTGTLADGSPEYTLPAIYDPSTGVAVAESVAIAEYLDKTYPNTPKLFPPGTRALQFAFLDWFIPTVFPIARYALPASNGVLNPVSEKYFRKKREWQFGTTMETMAPTSEEHVKEWGKVKAVFDSIDKWLQRASVDGPYLAGEQPGLADLILASYVLWMKNIWGDGNYLWEDVKTWHGGRWVKFLDGLQRYQVVAGA